MEDEFAFSLESDREMWEMSRACYEPIRTTQPSHDEDSIETSLAAFKGPLRLPLADSDEEDGNAIWTSSHIASDPAPPELSLFAIGARLAEFD